MFASADIDLSPIPGLTPAGRDFIATLARTAPAQAPVRQNAVRSSFWSNKMRCYFGWDDYRSDYRHALDLEASPEVLAYWKWLPVRAHPYGDSTLPAGTTLVVLTAQGGEIHELADDNTLRRRLKTRQDRFVEEGLAIRDRVADNFAAQLGLRHRLVRHSALSANRAKNRLILLNAEPINLRPEHEAAILQWVDRRPGATVEEIADVIPEFTHQVLMHLLVLGRLCMDLEHDRLSTDDYRRIRVYRDARQLEVAQSARLAKADVPVCSKQASLKPGTRIALGDELLTVTQFEGDSVLLLSDEGRSLSYNRFALLALLVEGKKARAFIAENQIVRNAQARLQLATVAERNKATQLFREVAHLMKYVDNLPAAPRAGVLITARQARILRRIRKAPPGTSPLVALLPDYSGRGTARLAPQVAVLMDRVLTEAFTTAPTERKSRAHYFGLLMSECEQQNLRFPSEETFRVNWNRKSKDYDVRQLFAEEDVDAHTCSMANLLEEGLQIARFYGERACLDSTKLPLVLCDSVNGKPLGPVYLSVLVDVYSRCVLAFHLDFAAPSAATSLALLQACVERHGFLPREIFCDNGPDLRADAFVQNLVDMRITHHNRPPHQPKFCALVESLLGRAQDIFFKELDGAVKARKSHGRKTKLPGGCWDICSLYEATADLLYEQLPKTLHSGIGMCPADRRDLGLHCKMVSPVLSLEEFQKHIARPIERAQGRARVFPGRGVFVKGNNYYTTEFDYLGFGVTKVEVRHDPTDFSFVWVQSPTNGHLVKALCRHHLHLTDRKGHERRLFTSEWQARQKLYGKNSRRQLQRDVAVKTRDKEQELKERPPAPRAGSSAAPDASAVQTAKPAPALRHVPIVDLEELA